MVALCVVAFGWGMAGGASGSPRAVTFAASDPPSVASTSYQSDAAHDGVAPSDGVTLPLKRLWDVPVKYPSYPLIAQNLVIVTTTQTDSNGPRVVAFDAHTGAQVWEHAVSGTNPWASAAYDNGRVFVVNLDGMVTALNATDGAELWTKKMPDEYAFSTPITAIGGVVYVTGEGTGGMLYAADESTGSLRWRVAMDTGDSSPTVSGDTVAITMGCVSYGFSLSGHQRWKIVEDCQGGAGATAAVWGDRLYYDVRIGIVRSMADGSTKGAFDSGSVPTFAGHLMFTVNEARLDALNIGSMIPLWHVTLQAPIVMPPLVMGKWVIVVGGDGAVNAFDAASGAQVWRDFMSTGVAVGSVGSSGPGMGAAGPLLVVPTVDHLVAYRAKGVWNIAGVPAKVAPGAAPVGPRAVPSAGAQGGVGFNWVLLVLVLLLGALAGGGVTVGVAAARSRRVPAVSATTNTVAVLPPPRPDATDRR
jgi:outer membrane protein assembly factor BamB